MRLKTVIFVAFFVLGVAGLFAYFNTKTTRFESVLPAFSAAKKTFDFSSLPSRKVLTTGYAVHQTFNNCAPAALSMSMYHYGIEVSQDELAKIMRPAHNSTGKNDDKETTPEEIGEMAERYNLISYYRPAGDLETLKALVANGVPIIVRTLLHDNEDFAHYRVVRGYDDINARLITDDGIEGEAVQISYARFNRLWKPYNYAYLVIAKPEQKELIESILGADVDETVAWRRAAENARTSLKRDQSDILAGYNLSVALSYIQDYKGSVAAYEDIEVKLTPHVIWYQIQPIESYFALGDYSKVFKLTDAIIQGGNPVYSELYLLRGEAYLNEGKKELAKEEFRKAVLYNKNLARAHEALASLE